ncbi:MAG: helix-turn-helix transcriptional regulator [Verrucomicrobiota bacterium]|nr:helix-turn-helix transcriptional regulator [Verrucomicrobiota bacterium]
MAPAQPVLSDAFSQVVKKHREKRKLSRAALAELSGLHQTYVGLLERGERSPNLDTAKAIANALGLSLGTMINQAEKIQKRPK